VKDDCFFAKDNSRSVKHNADPGQHNPQVAGNNPLVVDHHLPPVDGSAHILRLEHRADLRNYPSSGKSLP